MLRRTTILLLAMLVALTVSACRPVAMREDATRAVVESMDATTVDGAWDEIFIIGTEDRSPAEFSPGGFDQYEEFICNFGVDCSVADIPGGLYEGDRPRYYRDEAPQLTIIFQLSQDYRELLLHLARAGSETTAVAVDGGDPLLVTAEMLGSRDNGGYGAYDLPLGSLNAGSHTITFFIPDDGAGNGGYSWDFMSLVAR